ncbi:hypothetical protein [Clostridium sp.]|uniref:hypothetical protein n=1 Tax=Clostridium sp. TaxID=1506 RepID=UPI0026279479|nr:hypothetical protein [Clostridium sp.]
MEYKLSFPKDLDSFKKFVGDHLFNVDCIDDDMCKLIIDKVNNGDYKFTLQEIGLMQRISSIGDVCTCDTAHRIGMDGKTCAIAEV